MLDRPKERSAASVAMGSRRSGAPASNELQEENMSFNPLAERGIPVENQVRDWSRLNSVPYDKLAVDPYTRCRIILMNGIEIESAMFSHQFNRNTDVLEVKQALAMSRRIEQQQQKAINWLTPGDETTLELTIGYEQVAVDMTAWLARSEPDPYLQQTMDFALLEDFDHLYRYANLYELLEGKQADDLLKSLTEVMPGRPTVEEHRHPSDSIRRHYDKHTADPLSKLHAMTLVAAEQQTMNFYMTIGNRYQEPIARALYLEIGMIEEQHVTQYECLLDPSTTWLENLVMHEYNECYLYHSFAAEETDPRVKLLWEEHLEMEIGQLQVACDLMRRYDGKDPAEILPAALPTPMSFQPNKDYVRSVLADQLELTADGVDFTTDKPKRYGLYQDMVHDGAVVASEDVISQHEAQFGSDYRVETEGEHPNKRLRRKLTSTTERG
jgi:hypothetical protein